MTIGPNKKSQETYNIGDLVGNKGQDSEISSSEASWSNLVWESAESLPQEPVTLSPEQVKKIFEPIIQAVQVSEVARPMRDRVMDWVKELMNEAMKGPDLNLEALDNLVGNLYFFCEDIFQAVYDVFTLTDTGLEPAFKQAVEKYKGK